MKIVKYIFSFLLIVWTLPSFAQADRHDVRAGNRKFKKDNYKEAEIDYRKGLVKDSVSFASNYNLANTLYRQGNMSEARKSLEKVKNEAAVSANASDYFYNLGDIALKQKNYQAAVDSYKQSLIRNPEDMNAKENYIYAKLMLENQKKNGGGQNKDQNKNQDKNKNNKNQNQNQKQDRNQQNNQNQKQDRKNCQGQNQNQGGEQSQPVKISPQQARQMLQAVQSKEKETQDKVNKEKAELLKTKQKDKNW
ncbi:MAG: tetratricopeptide repeat protein [Bacteroidales bacterium]|jgi:tetratricopeptide (TPR) repeat protein|nr:tetratricopeptide repeat protein [Bacteroidales bacterium]MCI1785554.1 tetratricopeptide repeat protein [Bacteroidales bacterium]